MNGFVESSVFLILENTSSVRGYPSEVLIIREMLAIESVSRGRAEDHVGIPEFFLRYFKDYSMRLHRVFARRVNDITKLFSR